MLELIFQGFMEWAYGLTLECWEYFSSSLLGIMSMDYAYMKSHVPVMDEIVQVLLAVGWALLIGNLVFQALKSMAVGLGFEGEDPKLLFTRTFVFAFLLLASPQICEIGLSLTAKIIAVLEIPDAIDVTLVDEGVFGSLGAAWLLVIIFGLLIMFKVFRLLLEIAERYVILAVLTMTAPLAFATGGSKSTSEIFSGWCRMFGSMCTLMVTNVIFFKMLLSVLSTVPSGLDIIPWIVLILTIVKVARKADAIITRIGLNPAITGDSLGRGLPGALTYMVMRSATSRITKTLGKTAGKGNGGTSSGSPAGVYRTGGSSAGSGFYSRAASYTTQKAQQQNTRQEAARQGTASQSEYVRTGGAEAHSQEYAAGSAARSGSVVQQESFKGAETRKSSVPHGMRRTINDLPSVNPSTPGGKQAPANGHGPAGKEPASAAGGQGSTNALFRTAVSARRSASENPAAASHPGPAEKASGPMATRISQASAPGMRHRGYDSSARRSEQGEKAQAHTEEHTVSAASPARLPNNVGSSPTPTVNTQSTQRSPDTGTRYTLRPTQPVSSCMIPAQGGSAARQTAIHEETARTGIDGTMSARPVRPPAEKAANSQNQRKASETPSVQTPAAAARPGRNMPQVGSTPTIQVRQYSPAPQEPRPAGNDSVRSVRGSASVQHPGPAGMVDRERLAPKHRLNTRISGNASKDAADTGGRKAMTATIKGNVKRTGNTALSRRPRGKKDE